MQAELWSNRAEIAAWNSIEVEISGQGFYCRWRKGLTRIWTEVPCFYWKEVSFLQQNDQNKFANSKLKFGVPSLVY